MDLGNGDKHSTSRYRARQQQGIKANILQQGLAENDKRWNRSIVLAENKSKATTVNYYKSENKQDNSEKLRK